jgi:excisionase family DNA binding protein
VVKGSQAKYLGTSDTLDTLMGKNPNNLKPIESNSQRCLVCQNLLLNMQRFFDMFRIARKSSVSDWLTVDDIASELKISKSVVYRLIRSGELEAVNLVETNGEIPKKGHYRIKRSSLDQYLESKKVQPFSENTIPKSRSQRFPKVKNHLGL